jgi:solute carrier family 13 (sodium-dependent dicarboxylate transporter), member 2/3/5
MNETRISRGVSSELAKAAIVAMALGLTFIMAKIPLPQSMRAAGSAELTVNGQASIAVLVFALVLWITEAVPFHITGLLSMVLLAFLRVDTFTSIVTQGFGNHIIVFFIGVLVISACVEQSGLGKRISVTLLAKTGNDTRLIILGFLTVGALLSMWITDMAVAAILMPLGRAILEEEKIKPLKSNFGKALMISCAWGPIIGGIGTPAGCGPNPIAIGFMKDMAGIDVSFIEWMMFGVPAALLLILPSWGLLLIFFRPEIRHLSRSKEELVAEAAQLPRFSRMESATLAILLTTIVLWLSSPLLEQWLNIPIPISMPVLLASSCIFLPGVGRIEWKKIERAMSWSSIILVVSGISIGMMLYTSGAAGWLSAVLLGRLGGLHPFLLVFLVVLIVAILKIAFSSNTVTATIIIPIIIALSQELGISTLAIALPAALTSSLAFILVTSTPTNVIPYSAGYFSILDMAKSGIAMTVASSVIVSLVIYVIGTMSNLY